MTAGGFAGSSDRLNIVAFNQIPIIVVSATFAGEETNRISADLGADAFLPSPVDIKQFIATVKGLLGGERKQIPLKVLIIEDSPPQAKLIENILVSNGYQVDTAFTFQSALQTIAANSYELAIIDYYLPDGLGDALLDKLCQLQRHCVCLMITTDPNPELALDWMKRGAAAYLRKPFKPDYLLEIIKRVLRERNLLRIEDLLEERTRQLQLSEERFRTVADHTADWEIWIGPQQEILYMSPSCSVITGYQREEFIENPTLLTTIILDEDLKRYQAHEEQIQQPEDIVFEFRIRRKDGKVRWIEHVCHPVYGEDRQFMGRRASNRDITERKYAEEALVVREKYFRDLFENAGDAIFIEDKDDRIIDVNSRACKLLGYTREELLQMYVPDLQAPECRMPKGSVILGELDQSPGIPFETTDIRKDGVRVAVEVTTVPLGTQGGHLVLSIVRDISDRKKAEADRERLIRAIEQSGETIVITDLNGNIQYANPTFSKITGYSAQEYLGKSAQLLKSGAHDRQFYRDLWKTIASGKTWKGVMTNRKKDGSLFTEEVTVSPVCDHHGKVANYVAVKLDITEKLKSEKEKALLETQFLQAQKLESIGRLAGGVAHDFNNMLAVIIGHVDLELARAEMELRHTENLTEIRKAANRSADLTRQLLMFARKQPASPKAIDLNEAIAGMMKMLQRIVGENISIRSCPSTEKLLIKIDPSQLDQILTNLCINARDAISDVGEITITSTKSTHCHEEGCSHQIHCQHQKFAVLMVTDTGCGMDKDILTNAFEPFFTTKDEGRGTGLGLATVHGVVRQNGGFVSISSELGRGTTFKICLPLYTGSIEKSEGKNIATPRSRGHETLLVVEDELSLLKVIKKQLEEQGYTLHCVSSPEEAIAIANTCKKDIHLLLTDVVMPGMNGFELANQVLLLQPGIKVLFMSGYLTDPGTYPGCLFTEKINLIQKPFVSDALAAAVRMILEGNSFLENHSGLLNLTNGRE